MKKYNFGHMSPTKVQVSLRILRNIGSTDHPTKTGIRLHRYASYPGFQQMYMFQGTCFHVAACIIEG